MAGSLDPIGYDTTELRELARVRGDRYVAHGFLWATPPDSLPSSDGTAEFDRPATWTGSLDERQKPYLRRLPESERASPIARGWVADLVERAGTDGAAEALAYYESIGWLTGPVREELEDYLLAVDYRPGGSLEDMTRSDHVESLCRTARLAVLADGTGDRPDNWDDAPPEGADCRPVRGSGRGTEDDSETETRTGSDGVTDSDFEFGDTSE